MMNTENQNYRVITISPIEAEKILLANNNNRAVSRRNVNSLANEMLDGNWAFNGETIKIASDGTLLDGQHRLMAVIKSGTTQKFSVVKNLNLDSFKTIDVGRKRTAGDSLSVAGYANQNILAALVNRKIIFDLYGNFDSREKSTTTEIMNIAAQDERLIDAANYANKSHSKTRLMAPTLIAMCYYYLHDISPGIFDDFFDKVFNGFGVKGDPALLLRNHLTESRLLKLRGDSTHLFEYVIRAFEYELEGRNVRSIRLKRDESERLSLIQRFRRIKKTTN